MEASKIIELILKAVEISKEVFNHFLCNPYTDNTVYEIEAKISNGIDYINRELKDCLGIELYVEIIPTITDNNMIRGFLKIKKCEDITKEIIRKFISDFPSEEENSNV